MTAVVKKLHNVYYAKPSFRKQWVRDLSLVLNVFLFEKSLNQNVGSFKISYGPGQT